MKKIAIIIIGIGLFSSQTFAINLLGAFQQALTSDPTFQTANAKWLSDREQIAISYAGLLPHFDISSNYNYALINGPKININSENNIDLTKGSYHSKTGSYALTLQQPLFNYQAWAQLKSSKSFVKSAAATFAAAAQDLIYRTTSAYLNVLQASDVLRYTQAEKRATVGQLQQTKERYNVGLAAITEVYQAQARYDLVISQEISDKNNLAIAIEKLREITGEYYKSFAKLNTKLPLLSPQPDSISKWAKVAQEQNYDLLAARYQLETALENIKVESAARYPVLNAAGSYGQEYTNNFQGISHSATTDTTMLNLSLDFPIIQGGAVSAKTRQAEYEYQKATSILEKTKRSVISDTRQAYLGVMSGISEVNANKQAVISAKSSLQATKESYKVGTSTMIDVLQELSNLYESEKNYSTSQYNYLIETLALKQAAGTLSISDIQIINSWLQAENPTISKSAPKHNIKKLMNKKFIKAPIKTGIQKINNVKKTPKTMAITVSEQYLLKINPKHYAIQLMAAHNNNTIINFMNTHKPPFKIHCFQTYHNNKKQYILITGDYSTLKQAHIALQKLPAKIKILHPWIRNYAIIHKAIKRELRQS
jgi:outer membrane protein